MYNITYKILLFVWGGVVLVEIVTENTIHGVLGIELHFLKLKHYLNYFVGLKS